MLWRRFYYCLFILVLLGIPVQTTLAAPPPVYVDASATGNNTCLTWQDACTDLQNALFWAQYGQEIRVAEGTYKPGTIRAHTFFLPSGVKLYGGFPRGGGAFEARDWERYPTILDGDIGASGDSSDNVYHVVETQGAHSSTILDGFVVTGGNANGAACPGTGCGGGMYNHDSSVPVVRNTSFLMNYAGRGAGMYNGGSTPRLDNVIFERNSAATYGGGMENSQTGDLEITGGAFFGNVALYGGGMYNDRSSPTLANTLFVGNHAYISGGGMLNSDNSPDMTNVNFVKNKADMTGGGIAGSFSHSSIANSILWGNTAANGPQIHNSSSTAVVNFSVVQSGCPSGCTCYFQYSSDPDFVSNPHPGGDNIWGSDDDNYGDLRLEYTSPVIDMGSSGLVGAGVDTDYAGNPRFVDVPTVLDRLGTTPPVVDVGAYETPPEVIYVDASAAGARNGASWYDAFSDLQPALRWGRSGLAQVWVAQGTYFPGSTRNATFKLASGADVYGGFPIGGGGGWAARNPGAYPTILSGDIGVPSSLLDNSFQVVTVNNNDLEITLDGLSIIEGAAFGDSCPGSGCGGGIYMRDGDLTLREVILRDNRAWYGGALANLDGWLQGDRVLFESNIALHDGGAIFNTESALELTAVIFQGNLASSSGGAIDNYMGSVNMANVVFSNNHAGGRGGAIRSYFGSLLAVNSVFAENQAGIEGVELYLSSTSLLVQNGIIWHSSGSPISYVADSVSISIQSSLIKNGCPADPYWYCENILTGNPQFLRLPGPGLDGSWGTTDDDFGNLQLSLTSPAIDAGDNELVPYSLQTDLQGVYRFVDIPSVPDTGSGSGALIDLGPYEAHFSIFLPAVVR